MVNYKAKNVQLKCYCKTVGKFQDFMQLIEYIVYSLIIFIILLHLAYEFDYTEHLEFDSITGILVSLASLFSW